MTTDTENHSNNETNGKSVRKTYKQQMLDLMDTYPDDHIFIPLEFYDICDYDTVKRTLNRLVNDGVLRRIFKGYYFRPKYNEQTKQYSKPKPEAVAEAIAYRHKWYIAPRGNAALKALGFDVEVPETYYYVSDGYYSKWSYDDVNIVFYYVRPADIFRMSTLTATVVEAIRTIGRNNVTPAHIKHIKHIKKRLTYKEKQDLLRDTTHTYPWIYEHIRQIGKGVKWTIYLPPVGSFL